MNDNTRKVGLIVSVFIAIASLLFLIIIAKVPEVMDYIPSPAVDQAQVEEQTVVSEQEEKTENRRVFDFTWTTFKSNWENTIPGIKEFDIATLYDEEETNQGINLIYNIKASSYIYLMSDVEPGTNKVRFINLLAEPSPNQKVATNILFSFGNLIAASNTSLTPDERGDILLKLGFNNESLDDLAETYSYKGVEYRSGRIGKVITLSIDPE